MGILNDTPVNFYTWKSGHAYERENLSEELNLF